MIAWEDISGNKLLKRLLPKVRISSDASVLIMGITFKEDVTDIRNSKVVDIIDELDDFGISVDVIDPGAGKHEVNEEYKIDLKTQPEGKYDAVILAVSHKEYIKLR